MSGVYGPASATRTGLLDPAHFAQVASVSDYASLDAALVAIGNAHRDLLVTANLSVAANTTIPSNVTLRFRGGVISVASGVTLTINGKIDAREGVQLFSCADNTSSVVIDSIHQPYTSVMWYGAVGNNVADDSLPIQRTIDAALLSRNTKTVKFPPTTSGYKIANTLMVRPFGSISQTTVKLAGRQNCYTGGGTLTNKAALKPTFTNAPVIWVMNGRNVEIDDLTFTSVNNGITLSMDDKTTFQGLGRTDSKSPFAAIAFDGYSSSDVPSGNRYPGTDAYGNALSGFYGPGGGSSGCAIKRCEIYGFIVGIARTAGGASNGNTSESFTEDVFIENCMYGTCCGGTQSRSWSHTRISFNTVWVTDSNNFGVGASNGVANTALYIQPRWEHCAWLFDLSDSGSTMQVVGGYGEDLGGIGCLAAHASQAETAFIFTGCQFNFVRVTNTANRPDMTFWTSCSVTFNGCEFHSNRLVSFGPATFIGCRFTGIAATPQLFYFNSAIFKTCQIGDNIPVSGLSVLDNDLANPSDGNIVIDRIFRLNTGGGYDAYPQRNAGNVPSFSSISGNTLTLNGDGTGSATITATNSLFPGDVVLNNNTATYICADQSVSVAGWPVCWIDSVTGTAATLKDVAKSALGTAQSYSVKPPQRFYGAMKGDVNNTTTVSNVSSIASRLTAGTVLFFATASNQFRVVSVSGTTVTVNANTVSGTLTGQPINGFLISPRVMWRQIGGGNSAPTSGIWRYGDKVLLPNPPTNGPREWFCTTSGDASVGAAKFGGATFNTAANQTTDGSGLVTIAHGLGITPTFASVGLIGSASNEAVVNAVDATNLTVLVRNGTTGAAITTTNVGSIMWEARA